MLRASQPLHHRHYGNRTPHYAIRYWKRRWVHRMAMNGRGYSPTSGRYPEEYGHDAHMLRLGFDWKHRVQQKHLYKHWPWVSMNDDPIGDKLRKDTRAVRAFSCKDDRDAGCVPRFDLYAESGRDYRIRATLPLAVITGVLHENVAAHYSREDCERHVATVAERFATPLAVQEAGDEVVAWAKKTASLPYGLAVHVQMLCNDIVWQHKKKTYRDMQHRAGVLRTLEMEQYYALPPIVSGPAMPVTLAQPVHKLHTPFRTMRQLPTISPAYRIDQRSSTNKMPA